MALPRHKLPQHQLPLNPPRRHRAGPRPGPHAPRREPLWCALHLPRLALEVFAGVPADRPAAVTEGPDNAPLIAACNDPARRAGVHPGLALNAALALAPGMRCRPRRGDRERAALTRLAGWARQFTPEVAVADDDTLLLEIRGSLALFGGLEALHKRIRARAGALGYTVATAVAPTPRAAHWLSRAGDGACIDRVSDLPRVLGRLPLTVAGLEGRTRSRLEAIGARRVADLARLPRDGLARRYGRRLVALLDQALGRAPDPRASCRLPETFQARLALLYETADSARLAMAAGRLVRELAGWLAARCLSVSRMELVLKHRGLQPTRLTVGLAEPDRDPSRLEGLLAERLDAATLPAPVIDIELAAGECRPLADETRGLLPTPGERPCITRLIERLRIHLGGDAVAGVAPAADHRPERAWRWTPPGSATDLAAPAAPRPVWLLAEPAPLHRCPGGLHPGKLVDVAADPERIRAGWWDGDGRRRDYLAARGHAGMTVWLRRDEGQPGWLVAGLWG